MDTITIHITKGDDDDPEYDYNCETIDRIVKALMPSYSVEAYINGVLVTNE